MPIVTSPNRQPTPIRDSNGRLIGVDDPNSRGGQSRLPSASETIFNRPASNTNTAIIETPTSNTPRLLTGGGGSGRSNRISEPIQGPQQVSPQPSDTTKQSTNQVAQFDVPASRIPTLSDQAKQFVNIQSQMNVQKDYPQNTVTLAPSYPQRIAGRVGAFFKGFGKVGNKPVAPYGMYEVGGYATTVPSGRGTIVTPTSVTTLVDKKEAELAPSVIKAEGIGAKISSEEKAKAETRVEELRDYYQRQIDKGASLQQAKEAYAKDIEAVNQQTNANIQTRLSNSLELKQANQEYSKKAQEIGASQDVYGTLTLPSLSEYTEDVKKREYKEAGKVVAYTTASFVVPELVGAIGLAENYQNKVKIIDPKTLNIIGTQENTGTVLTDIGNIALIGGGVGLRINKVGQELKLFEAESKLNIALKSGEVKITPESLQTGKLVFDGQELNIGTKQLQKAQLQIDKLQEAQRITSLRLDKKVNVNLVGSTEQSGITDLLSSVPEYQTINTKEIMVGKYSRLKPTGQLDEGFIVRGLKSQGDEGKAINFVFKQQSTGKITGLNVITEDIKTGEILTARKALPSEYPESQFINLGEGTPPLEVFPIDRFKTKAFKKVGKSDTQTQEFGDDILKITRGESTISKLGNVKGTQSMEDLVGMNNLVTKLEKPYPVAKSKSVKIEALKKTMTGNRGITQEKAVIDILDKPIEFSLEPTKASKPYPALPKNKDILKEIDNSDMFKFETIPDKKVIEIPKMVGGEGITTSNLGQGSVLSNDMESLMSDIVGTVNKPTRFPRSPKIQLQEVDMFKEVNLPRTKVPAFKELKVKEISTTSLNLKNNVDTSIKELQAMRNYEDNLNSLGNISKLKGGNKNVAKQAIDELTKLDTPQLTKLNISQLTQPLNFTPYKPKPIDIAGLDFGLPSFTGGRDSGAGNKNKNKLTLKNLKRKSKYTASLASALFQEKPFKVSKKEYERLNKAVFSGAETRPILEIVDDKELSKQLKKVKF